MKTLSLFNKKHPEKVTIIDDADYELVSQHNWWLLDSNKNGTTFYAVAKINGKTTPLHKFLMGPNMDHIDGNGLNNQRSNLRPANRKQQNQNRRFTKNKTGFMGVYEVTPGRFQASIRIDGRNKSLGYYSSAAEASRIRETKAQELFGEFYRGTPCQA